MNKSPGHDNTENNRGELMVDERTAEGEEHEVDVLDSFPVDSPSLAGAFDHQNNKSVTEVTTEVDMSDQNQKQSIPDQFNLLFFDLDEMEDENVLQKPTQNADEITLQMENYTDASVLSFIDNKDSSNKVAGDTLTKFQQSQNAEVTEAVIDQAGSLNIDLNYHMIVPEETIESRAATDNNDNKEVSDSSLCKQVCPLTKMNGESQFGKVHSSILTRKGQLSECVTDSFEKENNINPCIQSFKHLQSQCKNKRTEELRTILSGYFQTHRKSDDSVALVKSQRIDNLVKYDLAMSNMARTAPTIKSDSSNCKTTLINKNNARTRSEIIEPLSGVCPSHSALKEELDHMPQLFSEQMDRSGLEQEKNNSNIALTEEAKSQGTVSLVNTNLKVHTICNSTLPTRGIRYNELSEKEGQRMPDFDCEFDDESDGDHIPPLLHIPDPPFLDIPKLKETSDSSQMVQNNNMPNSNGRSYHKSNSNTCRHRCKESGEINQNDERVPDSDSGSNGENEENGNWLNFKFESLSKQRNRDEKDTYSPRHTADKQAACKDSISGKDKHLETCDAADKSKLNGTNDEEKKTESGRVKNSYKTSEILKHKEKPVRSTLVPLRTESKNTDSYMEEQQAAVMTDKQSMMNEKAIIKRVMKVINNLKSAFDDTFLRHDARIKALRQNLASIEQNIKISKTMIAVVGDTGSGKSSLINALIGHRCILPTSGIRACTSVAIEIEENSDSNKFEADIKFLSKQEWEQELQILLRDLTDRDGKLRTVPPKVDTDTYVSYVKVKAVYKKIDTLENLSQITEVTECLGKTLLVESDSPDDFTKKVSKYITQPKKASADGEGEFWPIVKLAHFRLPSCKVLSSGVILVDLPGFKDFNQAREIVATQYKKNCSAMWIVSSIHRAIDEKTAKTLLGDSFRRQLMMDGQYGNTAFICSKTEDLKPSEIIEELGLKQITEDLENKLSALEKEKECLERKMNPEQEISSLRKYKENRKDCDLKDIKNGMEKINELKFEISTHRKKLYGICAKERNKYAKEEIKKDFIAGIKEIKKQADRGDFEEYDDYDSEEDDEQDAENDTIAQNLRVFCCSAAEYQKLKFPSTNDGPPLVFSAEEETEIPSLQNYVLQITSSETQPNIERIVRSLGEFVFGMNLQNYVAEDISVGSCLQEEALSSIDDLLKNWETKVDTVIDRLSQEIETDFTSIQEKLDEGARNAENKACQTCLSWVDKDSPSKAKTSKTRNLSFATYKATINREGAYKSKALNGEINFNQELTDPMYSSLATVWDQVFNNSFHKIFESLKKRLHSAFDIPCLCIKLGELGVIKNKKKKMQSELLMCVVNKLNKIVSELKRDVTDWQRNISRMITPIVQECLSPTYKRCQQEHGLGTFQRMKDHMYQGIESSKNKMFAEARDKIMVKLNELKDHIVKYVKAKSMEILEEVKRQLKSLWDHPVCQERPQYSKLKEAIIDAFSKVCKIYSLAGITKTDTLPEGPLSSTSHAATEEMPCTTQQSRLSTLTARVSSGKDLSSGKDSSHTATVLGSHTSSLFSPLSEDIQPTQLGSLNSSTHVSSKALLNQCGGNNTITPFEFSDDSEPDQTELEMIPRKNMLKANKSSLQEKKTRSRESESKEDQIAFPYTSDRYLKVSRSLFQSGTQKSTQNNITQRRNVPVKSQSSSEFNVNKSTDHSLLSRTRDKNICSQNQKHKSVSPKAAETRCPKRKTQENSQILPRKKPKYKSIKGKSFDERVNSHIQKSYVKQRVSRRRGNSSSMAEDKGNELHYSVQTSRNLVVGTAGKSSSKDIHQGQGKKETAKKNETYFGMPFEAVSESLSKVTVDSFDKRIPEKAPFRNKKYLKETQRQESVSDAEGKNSSQEEIIIKCEPPDDEQLIPEQRRTFCEIDDVIDLTVDSD